MSLPCAGSGLLRAPAARRRAPAEPWPRGARPEAAARGGPSSSSSSSSSSSGRCLLSEGSSRRLRWARDAGGAVAEPEMDGVGSNRTMSYSRWSYNRYRLSPFALFGCFLVLLVVLVFCLCFFFFPFSSCLILEIGEMFILTTAESPLEESINLRRCCSYSLTAASVAFAAAWEVFVWKSGCFSLPLLWQDQGYYQLHATGAEHFSLPRAVQFTCGDQPSRC